MANDEKDLDSVIWHAQLGHIGHDRMVGLARKGLLGLLAKVNLLIYESCLANKTCLKFFGKTKRATKSLQFIHSDICRSMSVKVHQGTFYFLTFISNYSQYGYVYLIIHRYESLDCFKHFLVEVENQLDKSVKILRTDQRRECLSNQF